MERTGGSVRGFKRFSIQRQRPYLGIPKNGTNAFLFHTFIETRKDFYEGILPSSEMKTKEKKMHKCLDCPTFIVRGKRCPSCGDKKRSNDINEGKTTPFLDKATRQERYMDKVMRQRIA